MFDDWRAELDKRDEERDYRRLDRAAIRAAIRSLRHVPAFHTRDVAEHRLVTEAHPKQGTPRRFHLLIERYLREHAIWLSLRGPLPGHEALGKRWMFRDEG